MKTILILLSLTFTGFVRAGLVTLTAQSHNGTNDIAALTIGPYEVAELVSFPRAFNHYNDSTSGYLQVFKDGRTFIQYPYAWTGSTGPQDPLIVVGPATIQLIGANNGSAFCTIRVTPESFPPDRTILVPPGTNQARVTLECSTNLVHWSVATNGVYGPLPEAKFFRIKLGPVQ